MAKLIAFFLFFSVLSSACFAEYEGKPKIVSVQTFKGRFTTGEFIGISAAVAQNDYIPNVISTLSEMGIVKLDSELVKNSLLYLTPKSIISKS